MQLKLELTTGPNSGEQRIVGGTGHTFTVGTSAGATWLLPLTADAPGDLRIDTTRDGLVASLVAGTAFLDQRALTADTPRPLLPGSLLQICGHQIRVHGGIPTAMTADAHAMQPTISSILAQRPAAAPASTEPEADWVSALTETPPAERPEWASLGQYEAGQSPSAPLMDSATSDVTRAFLPDDWAGDLVPRATPPSDPQNRMTQSSIADATLALGRSLDLANDDAPMSATPSAPPAALTAFLRGAGLGVEELGRPLTARMEALGQMLRASLDTIARLEDAQARADTELGLATPLPHAATRQTDATLLAVAQSPEAALQALTARLSDLEQACQTQLTGTLAFAASARDQLDPAAVETASAAGGGAGLRLNRAGAAWATYRNRYTRNDPLSHEALADAIRRARGTVATTGTPEKTERTQ